MKIIKKRTLRDYYSWERRLWKTLFHTFDNYATRVSDEAPKKLIQMLMTDFMLAPEQVKGVLERTLVFVNLALQLEDAGVKAY